MDAPTSPQIPASGPGSLHGLRVLELSTSVAGPVTGQILGDLGAEVIKVERVGVGDDTRRWAPPAWNGISTAFLGLNRNKKSVELDYRDPRGHRILEQLVACADVLVQNLRPGALARAGFSWARLQELNPRLIYCEITGFGDVGPRAGDAAYDPLLQAYTGMTQLMPAAESGPARVPLSIIDKGTAHWAVIGILEALRRRDATGRGSHVGVSLLHTALEWLGGSLMSARAGLPPSENLGSGHPGVVPYGAFPASDGWLFVAAGNQPMWERLIHALGAPELNDLDGFGTNEGRSARRGEVTAALSEVTRRFTVAEIAGALTAAGVPHSPIRSARELPDDPQVRAIGAITDLPHPQIDNYQVVNLPVAIDGAHLPHQSPPPLLGADTVATLLELGLTGEQVRELLDAGVAGATSTELREQDVRT